MDLPTIGRIVHYVMRPGDYDERHATGPRQDGDNGHRAAVIVRVNDNSPTVNLWVFVNGPYDGHSRVLFVGEVPHALSEAMEAAGTWHWPEREPAQQYNRANLQFIMPPTNVVASATFPTGATYDVQSGAIGVGHQAQDPPAEDGGEDPK
jgi:hypothetical protein